MLEALEQALTALTLDAPTRRIIQLIETVIGKAKGENHGR
jgi:hypothetical protein